MPVNLIFPTPVLSEDFRSLTEEEKDVIYAAKSKIMPNAGNVTSQDTYILENPKLLNLKKFFLEKLDLYATSIIRTKSPIELYITQSWINYTEPNGFHHKHIHQNSLLSGVFYIDAEAEDQIEFYRDDIYPFQFEYEDFDILNANSWWMPAAAGRLYIFPSRLVHGVNPTRGKSTRISLSFNTFLKGTLGVTKNLTELKL